MFMDPERNELCWIIIFRLTDAFTRGILIPIFHSDYFCPCKRSWGVIQPFPFSGMELFVLIWFGSISSGSAHGADIRETK